MANPSGATSTSTASSFETHRFALLLWMRTRTLMVRSASSRVSNHDAGCARAAGMPARKSFRATDNRWDISCPPVYSEQVHPESRHLPGHQQGEPSMYEAPAIIGSCINCIAPGSLGATLALILIGAGVALTAERRKLIRARR